MNQPRLCLCALLVLLLPVAAWAQAVAGVQVTVVDQLGAAVPGATLVLRHSPSGLQVESASDGAGRAVFAEIPVGVVDLVVALSGFVPVQQRVEVSGAAPNQVLITLRVAALTDEVRVAPVAPVVDATSAGTRHAISSTLIARMPAAVSSRGLESVLVSFPGFAQNANGAIHPRGAHNQMTYVLDGLPISDQLTGAFANALDAAVVQTAEVFTGNIPAEFGGKVSAVAVLHSKTGLGVRRPAAGSISVSAGGFGTAQGAMQVGGESGRVAYFASMTALRTNRFLDQVSLANLHNAGGFVRGFGRVDLKASERESLRLHVVAGRSGFEVANLRSQQQAGQDQRQALADVSAWAGHQRALGQRSSVESTVGYRTTFAALDPSAGDTPVTAEQDRRTVTLTATTRVSTSVGAHLLRAGADVQRFPVRERFSMGITDQSFNAPESPTFNVGLTPHDLTRGGVPFLFEQQRAGLQVGAFVQGQVQAGRLSLNLGLRHDEYRFLVNGRQVQPRVGIAYRWPSRDVVLRASYNRNYQTPPNENLLLASSPAASRLAPASVREATGGGYRPIRPERQHVFEAGVQTAIGGVATVDGSVYRKTSHDQQDNNNFFDTGIVFPTSLRRLDVLGAEARLSLLPRGGWSGSLSVTTGRAIASPPFTGGLFLGQDAVDLLSAGRFAIDHDQRVSMHGQWTYNAPGAWWLGGAVRYDSGLVANPSDPAEVAADPDFADVLPYVNLTSTPARVRPRTVVDLGGGFDVRRQGRALWNVQLQVTNVTNRVALYNFQSVFVGTRLIQPRTVSLRIVRAF